MSNVVPFDTLAMALALRDEAGFDQKQAEGTARVLSRMLVADLVTKADLAAETGKLDTSIREVNTRLEASIRELEIRMNAKVEATVATAKADIIKWLFGTIAAQTGLLLAAIKLIH